MPHVPTSASATKNAPYPCASMSGKMVTGPAISEAVVANRTIPNRLPSLEAGEVAARYCATLGWNSASPNACARRRTTTCHSSEQPTRARHGTVYPNAPAIMAKRLPRCSTTRSSGMRRRTASSTNRLFCKLATNGPAPSDMT